MSPEEEITAITRGDIDVAAFDHEIDCRVSWALGGYYALFLMGRINTSQLSGLSFRINRHANERKRALRGLRIEAERAMRSTVGGLG